MKGFSEGHFNSNPYVGITPRFPHGYHSIWRSQLSTLLPILEIYPLSCVLVASWLTSA
ncbi:hypothetical protein NIES39_K04460 [Arthrospira platensis NIES-39]|nr:hypothetical protein NIES39_K04460 [Arthrospira platensis NIES-39]